MSYNECPEEYEGFEGPPKVGLNDLLAAECPECGSTDTEWHCTQTTRSGVADGRLRLNEITTLFFCGCNECSETIKTVSGDELAAMMTGS